MYRCIVVDPPWPYGAWGVASHGPNKRHKGRRPDSVRPVALPYPSLDVGQICALPLTELAAADCELYLWTTQRYLSDAFTVLAAWRFRYCQTLVWCKTPMGSGQGGVYTPTTEFVLLARRGRMPACTRIPTTWFHWKRTRRHSAKPEPFYDLLETVTEGPRLELFARRQRLGWTCIGDALTGEPIEDALLRLGKESSMDAVGA